MQRKLTAIQVSEVRKALESLQNTISLLSRTVIGVGGRTYKLEKHLHNICEHGTTDGNPWKELGPPIPDGWRKADHPDDYKRDDVKFRSKLHREWKDRSKCSQGLNFFSRYTYIVPIEPALTDKDAEERP